MPAVVLVGAQWGDEGKGKITDFLAEEADCVVRYQGGSNAGHTVELADEKFMLHLIPSGILHAEKICVIGNGVVIDLAKVIEEIDGLHQRGINTSNLRISSRASVVMPYHKKIDEIEDRTKKIGTTKRGIGPTYADKISRVGFRISDLLHEEYFRERFTAEVARKNRLLEEFYNEPGFDAEEMIVQLMAQIETLKKYIADTGLLVHNNLKAGKKVLFEGAQGTLLDIDHGTYPYVTSSYPTAGGACVGSGIGPTEIGRVIGVAKAYTTRVGEGPFPTELLDATGEIFRERGAEFGTTTGRPRRCGWFDVLMAREAVMLNGASELAIMKMDILDGLKKINLCISYRYKGKLLKEFPQDFKALSNVKPVYKEVSGWPETLTKPRSYSDFHPNAKAYLRMLSDMLRAKISMVSVGSAREDTIFLDS